MKSGKTIDISKSSLVSLKAELARKQEEVKDAKASQSYIKLPPKPKESVKVNPGVEQRNQSDLELLPEEVDLMKKSREVLEVKSKLYDELQKGNTVSEEGKSQYLVDFKQKDAQSTSELSLISDKKIYEDSDENDNADSEDLDTSEWVEYTDYLGRTRTCHYTELTEMKEKDRKMAKDVRPEKFEQQSKEPSVERPPELLSSDMEREIFRKKWEEEERELLNKKDVHYEDVLFDEARAHGVGYFKFSRDEDERRKEQEMMKKVREDTETRQKEVRLLRERRENQRQARLIAARQRQRSRLGLPPLTEAEILEGMKTEQKEAEKEKDEKEEPAEVPSSTVPQLEESLKRTAHVRPWDVGKTDKEVMSQDEWVERQRNERKSEFAPSYTEARAGFDPMMPPPQMKKRKLEPCPAEDAGTCEAAIDAGLRYFREQAEKKVHQKQLD